MPTEAGHSMPKSKFPNWIIAVLAVIGGGILLTNRGGQESVENSNGKQGFVSKVPAQIEVPAELQYAFIDGKPLSSAVREIFVLNEKQAYLVQSGVAPNSPEVEDVRKQRVDVIRRLLDSGYLSRCSVIEKNGVPVGIDIDFNLNANSLPEAPNKPHKDGATEAPQKPPRIII